MTADRNPLALDFLTCAELSAPDLISVAADHGCAFVSLLVEPLPFLPDYGLRDDTPLRRETRSRCEATGVRVDMVEAFVLAPETRVEGFRAAFESAAWLGARQVNALGRDPDAARLVDNLGRYAALAAEYGLQPLVEFMALSDLNSIESARTAIRRSGAANIALEVDALHVQRTGADAGQLRALPPGMIGRSQINDGPLELPREQWRFEGLQQRRIPGEGEFPLVDFASALPAGVIVGVEVPLKDLMDGGVPASERARRAIAGARRIMSLAAARAAV
jgi:sugar phosphate isomerase/epimerase